MSSRSCSDESFSPGCDLSAMRMVSSSAFLLPLNLMVPMMRPSYSMVPGARAPPPSCAGASVGVTNETAIAATKARSLRMARKGARLVGDGAVDHAHAPWQPRREVGIVRDHDER